MTNSGKQITILTDLSRPVAAPLLSQLASWLGVLFIHDSILAASCVRVYSVFRVFVQVQTSSPLWYLDAK